VAWHLLNYCDRMRLIFTPQSKGGESRGLPLIGRSAPNAAVADVRSRRAGTTYGQL